MDDAKIYGVCLSRLKHQIQNTRRRYADACPHSNNRVLLESYLTSDIEEVIDILELYDVEVPTPQHLRNALEDLAYTLSVLTRESLSFGLTEEGHLGLYLVLKELPSPRKDKKYHVGQASVSV